MKIPMHRLILLSGSLSVVISLGACGASSSATTARNTSTTHVTHSQTAGACPGGETLKAVAAASAPGQITGISNIQCASGWAVADIDALDGSTDLNGKPQANAYVQLFQAKNGQWVAVDQSLCDGNEVPTALRTRACNSD